MTQYWRAVLGAFVIVVMQQFGVLLILSGELYFMIIGYLNYFVSGMIIYFLAVQYQNTPFYKSLGRDE